MKRISEHFAKASPYGLSLLLVILTFLAYQPAWHAGFIWDDAEHLTENPCIVGPLGFKAIWTSSRAIYYPLVLTNFWIQHAIWGLNPLPYHLVNIAFHAACALLLWWVLVCLRVRGAWLGAVLWALHPVQDESVAWVTELKNTQSCFFYLLAIGFALKWHDGRASAEAPNRERTYWLALLFAVLAMLSKSSTVVLPAVIGLCWWWMDRQWRWSNVPRLVPFFLISGAASAWTIWEQKYHSHAAGAEWTQNWPERVIIAGKGFWFYLGKLVWPHPLVFIYPRWKVDASNPAAWLPLLGVILVLALLWPGRHPWKWPVFIAFGYFVIALLPVLDFFDVYFFRYSFVGDHFQYLASMGPLALAGSGITVAADLFRKRRLLCQSLMGGVLVALSVVLTWRQARGFTDAETVWRTTIARNPNAAMPELNLGAILERTGRSDEAAAHFRRACEIRPGDADAHHDLGAVLFQKGQVNEAIAEYRKALELQPRALTWGDLGRALLEKGQVSEALVCCRRAAEIDPNNPDILTYLGDALFKSEQVDESIVAFRAALQIRPSSGAAHCDLGTALFSKGKIDEAILQMQEGLRINPGLVNAHAGLGTMLARKGQVDAAIGEFQRALELRPRFALAACKLGTLLFQRKQLDGSIHYLQLAVECQPDFAEAHSALADALAEKGALDGAIVQFQRTVELQPHNAYALFRLGNLLLQKGRSEEARVVFQNAVEGNPDFAEAHNNLGALLLQKGRVDEAIGHFQKALKIRPDYPNAQTNLQQALLQQERQREELKAGGSTNAGSIDKRP